jgi:hypothetical protein
VKCLIKFSEIVKEVRAGLLGDAAVLFTVKTPSASQSKEDIGRRFTQ